VEIKFRKEKLLAMMKRLDPTCRNLSETIANASTPPQEASTAKADLAARQQSLTTTYSSIAIHFADLHDTPKRMKAKSTIREIVPWESARTYFYWRLKRRLLQEEIVKRFTAALAMPRKEVEDMLDALSDPSLDDSSAVAMLQSSDFEERVAAQERALKSQQTAGVLSGLASVDPGQIASSLQGKVSPEDIQVRSQTLLLEAAQKSVQMLLSILSKAKA
jgi:acetyl-CoA carboxylase/biotin carboxylase 1